MGIHNQLIWSFKIMFCNYFGNIPKNFWCSCSFFIILLYCFCWFTLPNTGDWENWTMVVHSIWPLLWLNLTALVKSVINWSAPQLRWLNCSDQTSFKFMVTDIIQYIAKAWIDYITTFLIWKISACQ